MRPDWFYIPEINNLVGVPGIRLAKGKPGFEIHRSHLPLLDYLHPKAPRPLTDTEARWAERDRRTEALGFKLRTTQQSGIDYVLARSRGALIGDEMRLGKTLTSLMCHDPASGPLLIVAPLTARAVWFAWARRVFPDLEIAAATGRKLNTEVLSKPIVFIHYDLLRYWQSTRPIGTVIFDEAHVLTNRESRRTQAAILIASRAQRVIPMTGTPIWNTPPDLWAILGLVAPGAWGSYHDFAQRYGDPQPTAYGTTYLGISNGDELNARKNEVMIRRTWAEGGVDVPPISRSVSIIDIDEKTQCKLDVIAGGLREQRANTAAHLASYRKAIAQFKVKAAIAEAAKCGSRDEPCVVWTWHVDTATKIALECGGFLITGEQSIKLREDIIERWKRSKAGVLVATMAVAQVAVDFSHARIAIFAELDYTPAMVAQAEMRTFHPSRGMSIIFIVLNHVLDQRMVIALERKLANASAVNVGAATEAIQALTAAVFGPKDDGDLSRFIDDLLSD